MRLPPLLHAVRVHRWRSARRLARNAAAQRGKRGCVTDPASVARTARHVSGPMFHISETLTLQKFREISRKIEIFRETSYTLWRIWGEHGADALQDGAAWMIHDATCYTLGVECNTSEHRAVTVSDVAKLSPIMLRRAGPARQPPAPWLPSQRRHWRRRTAPMAPGCWR